jgi:hypothetical protein
MHAVKPQVQIEGLLMASSFTARFDANVMYGSALRSLLMHLALTGLFQAKWSADVHEEWIAALLQNRPICRVKSLSERTC